MKKITSDATIKTANSAPTNVAKMIRGKPLPKEGKKTNKPNI